MDRERIEEFNVEVVELDDSASRLNEIFTDDTIKKFREDYKDNPVELCAVLQKDMGIMGILATPITIKGQNMCRPVVVKNETTEPVSLVSTVSYIVLVSGNKVIDFLFSDKLHSIKEYYYQLKENNDEVNIDKNESYVYSHKTGKPTIIDSWEDLIRYGKKEY